MKMFNPNHSPQWRKWKREPWRRKLYSLTWYVLDVRL